jgi:hypothetical protein
LVFIRILVLYPDAECPPEDGLAVARVCKTNHSTYRDLIHQNILQTQVR